MIDLPGEPPVVPRFLADIAGVVAGARFVPSPHHDERPPEAPIDTLVIHNISLPPGEYGGPEVEDFFLGRLNPAAHPFFAGIGAMRVSAHFFVRRDGEVVQFVPCELRAWHAGVSSWNGRERCNDYSIGIELEGTDTRPYTARQYRRLAALLRRIAARYPIAAVVGHSDVAPGRKTDPGPAFDWSRLAGAPGWAGL